MSKAQILFNVLDVYALLLLECGVVPGQDQPKDGEPHRLPRGSTARNQRFAANASPEHHRSKCTVNHHMRTNVTRILVKSQSHLAKLPNTKRSGIATLTLL